MAASVPLSAPGSIALMMNHHSLRALNAPSDHGGIDRADRGTANHTFEPPRCTVRGVSSHCSTALLPSHGRSPLHLLMPRSAFVRKARSSVSCLPQLQEISTSRSEAVIPLVRRLRSWLA